MSRQLPKLPLADPASGERTSPIIGEGEMADLTRRFDWSQTPLGPVETWPDTLLTTVNLLLASRHPVFLWWGPELIQFYNDGYRPSIGFDKHPSALGQRGIECWPEIWPIIGPQIESVMTRGESTWHRNQLVPIFRDGKMEEVFWTYSYSPVRDKHGDVRGTLVVCSETTEQVLGERRMRTLLEITSAAHGLHLGDDKELGAHLIQALSSNPADVPFAGLYTIADREMACQASTRTGDGSIFRPEAWPIRQAAESTDPLLLTDVPERIGKVSFEPWPESVQKAYLVPLGENSSGAHRLMLLGISSRLPFDARYETYFRLISNRIAELLDASDGERQRAHQAEQLRVQRTRMADLFQQSPAFIAVLRGPDHVFELTNPLYQHLIGGRNVLGLPVREALPEVVDQNVMPLLDGVYQTGTPFVASDFHVSLAREPNRPPEERILDFVYQPIREADDTISGILVLGIDVTERRRAEKALEQSRLEAQRRLSELEAVYSSAPIGLALFDPVEFRFLRLNDRQAEIVGLPKEQILGKGLTEIAPIEGLDDMFRQVAAGHPIKNALLEGELPMRPGEHRYWTVNYEPVYAPDGTLQAISAASLEITPQKRAEAALIQSEKLAAVGRLASSIAHEINNPLEAVTNLLFLLETSDLPKEAKRLVAMAQHELDRVTHITLQTLRFHRQSINAREISPSEILDDVLALFQRQITDARVAVECQYQPVKPMLGYEQDLRQVFTNFIENALDSLRGKGKLIIRQRQSREWNTGRPGIRVTIADNGHGMSPEIRRSIFEPFFTTKETTGTGLGLWVSSEILQKHQGKVRVRSNQRPDSHGTVFTIFFPYDAFPSRTSDVESRPSKQ